MKKQKIVFPEMYFPRLREVDDALLRVIARSDSGLDEERHFAALKQVFSKQNGYLAAHQDYCPGEVLEWAAYRPERAWAYYKMAAAFAPNHNSFCIAIFKPFAAAFASSNSIPLPLR